MSKAVIRDVKDQRLASIKTIDFFKSKVSDSPFRSKISSTLPFRVKFINIGIEGYGPNNPAPIGIAIIGFNNYIL
jgi:hypothetical protein